MKINNIYFLFCVLLLMDTNLISDIPIFYINLNRAIERKNKIEKLFEQYNITNYSRIEAVDGNDLDLEEYKRKYTFTKPNLNKYEIACLLSHIKAIKCACELGLKYALIVEDDVNFDYFKYKKITIENLVEKLESFDCTWNILQLVVMNTKKNFTILSELNDDEFIKGYDCGAVAYIINYNGMEKIINYYENANSINVCENFMFEQANTFMTKPYFSYYFRDVVPSSIRDNSKASMATQTTSKRLWDDYYKNIKN